MYSKSFNECLLIGKCGNELTLRYTQKGVPVTNLILGTQDVWKDNSSSEINKAIKWHKIVVWGKLAERVVKFAKKGSILLVKGPISYRDHTTQEGQKIQITEIKAIKVQKLQDPKFIKVNDSNNDLDNNSYDPEE